MPHSSVKVETILDALFSPHFPSNRIDCGYNYLLVVDLNMSETFMRYEEDGVIYASSGDNIATIKIYSYTIRVIGTRAEAGNGN